MHTTASPHSLLTAIERREGPGATIALARSVLVATDGSTYADGAVSLALDLARMRGAAVRLISVVEPALNLHPTRRRRDQIEVDRREQRLAEIQAQLARLGDDGLADEVRVVDGAAVGTIARTAAEEEPSLVALGLHTHGVLEQVFRDETALRVLRRLRRPLLAVAPRQRGLPHDAIVAMDFGAAAMSAARDAASLLAPSGRLRLLHVASETAAASAPEVVDRLDALAAELGTENEIEVECVLRRGEVHAELDAELRARPTELMALGCRGCGASEPTGPGRLTSAYVRAAGVSLVVGVAGRSVTH